MIPTTIRLTDKQRKWMKEMNLNISKYVRSLIDKDMANRQFKARFVQMIHNLRLNCETKIAYNCISQSQNMNLKMEMILFFYEQIMDKNGQNPQVNRKL